MPTRHSRRAALGWCAAAVFAPSLAWAEALFTLKAGGVPEDSVTPALWAEQSGIFAKHGLDVHIDAQHSGSAVTAAVLGGSYNIGKSSVLALIIAHARGLPVVLIAPAGIYDSIGHSGLIVKADSPIKTGADLDGKTIGVSSLDDLYTVGTYSWVAKRGGDWQSVKLVEIPIAAIPAALETGRVDAGNTIDPQLEAALQTKRFRYLADTDGAIAPKFIYTAWFTTQSYLRDNRQSIQNFSAALRDAALFTNAHPNDTIDVLSKFSGVQPAVIAKSPRVEAGVALDPALLQPVIDAAAKFHIIPAAFDARDFIDRSRNE